MLAGYFVVYVVSPYDLKWRHAASLDRLSVQTWPSLMICGFMALQAPAAQPGPPPSPPAARKKSRRAVK